MAELRFTAEIARWGVPAPIQAGKRWVVERTHSWMNNYGKLRRCTEKSGRVVDFYLYLAATLVTLRMLIRRSTKRFRWDGRPTTRRLSALWQTGFRSRCAARVILWTEVRVRPWV